MVSALTACFVFFILIKITSAQSPCRTPDGWNGNCVVLQQCRPLYRLISRQLTTEHRNFLRESQCGHDGTNPFVCCPNTFTIDDLPSKTHCGAQVEVRVLGGDETHLNEFPWMALLHYTKPSGAGGYFCGGALIHENYVLTVAHCVRGPFITQKRYVLDWVRFGEHDLRTNPDCQENECADPVLDIPIAETIVHENYLPTTNAHANDITLIRLQRAAPYSDYIRPICLPVDEILRNKIYDGTLLEVAGFGRTENGTQSDVLLKVQIHGFNWEQCLNIYQRAATNLSNKQLCAGGEEEKGTCGGDSDDLIDFCIRQHIVMYLWLLKYKGGPLVADHVVNRIPFRYLVGILSFGAKQCGTSGFPSVYTRVDQYMDWILDHMKK